MGNIIRSPQVREREPLGEREPLPKAAPAVPVRAPAEHRPAVATSAPVSPSAPPAPAPPQPSLAELKAQAEAECAGLREAATREGYQAGLRKGESEAKQQVDRLVSHLQDMLIALGQERERVLAEMEACMLPVLFAALNKIVGESALSAEFVQACVRRALTEVGGREPLVVRLHPSDAVLLLPDGQQALTDAAGCSVTIVADPGVRGGGCVIETPRGDVDAQLTTQFGKLKQVLLEAHGS